MVVPQFICLLSFIHLCLIKAQSDCSAIKNSCTCDRLNPQTGLSCWLCGFCLSDLPFKSPANSDEDYDELDQSESLEKVNGNLKAEQIIDTLVKITTEIDGINMNIFDRNELNETAEKVRKLSGLLNGKANLTSQSLYLEGDVLPTLEQLDSMIEKVQNKTRIKRKTSNEYGKWPLNIRYDYDHKGKSSSRLVKAVDRAMKFWDDHTCLSITKGKPKNRTEQYMYIVHATLGCASYVGKIGKIAQPVMLGRGCETWAIAAHEISHALGLMHEQSRPDRDKHVKVNWENIRCNWLSCEKSNFERCDLDGKCHADFPYDYGSNMHYGRFYFARRYNKETLTPKVYEFKNTLGSRLGPTFYDVRQMNKIYCPDSCKSSTSNCDNNGYANPNNCNTCLCSEGFTGQFCQEVEKGTPEDCGGKLTPSSNWKTFSSPNYPSRHHRSQKCTWLIEAPLNNKVEFRFDGKFALSEPGEFCMYNFVEVRIEDLQNTGPRFCGSKAPTSSFESNLNQALVLLRSFTRSTIGFQIKYRILRVSNEPKTTVTTQVIKTTTKGPFCCRWVKKRSDCDSRLGGIGTICCRYDTIWGCFINNNVIIGF